MSIRSAASTLYYKPHLIQSFTGCGSGPAQHCTQWNSMEMEIKHLLQLKSNASMNYLRNLAVTSRRHNTAIADAREIPNYL